MRVAVWNGGKLQRWLLAVRVADLCILDAWQVVILLPRYHEGGKVSCVDGQEDDSKKCPDAGHESTRLWLVNISSCTKLLPGSQASGTVNLDRCLEEHRPYQPVGTEQGEFVLMGGGGLLLQVILREMLKLSTIPVQHDLKERTTRKERWTEQQLEWLQETRASRNWCRMVLRRR